LLLLLFFIIIARFINASAKLFLYYFNQCEPMCENKFCRPF